MFVGVALKCRHGGSALPPASLACAMFDFPSTASGPPSPWAGEEFWTHQASTFPGFRIPSGSNATFNRRIAAISSVVRDRWR
ncbi:MAG: hypothetical protein RL367_2910 [Pseudomonadota bacterium]